MNQPPRSPGDGTGRSEHLFVIRMWREPPAAGDRQWRGSVDHVSSGQKQYFAATGDLVEFIMRRLEETKPGQ